MMTEREPQHGIVAFLDVLSTKEIGRAKHEELIKFIDAFESLVKTVKEKAKAYLDVGNKPVTFPKFESLVLSDTIIITGSFEKEASIDLDAANLMHAGNVCAIVIKEAFERNIFLRGGISIGEFYRLNNSILGKAVSEVAEYYEQMQWIGVSLAPSAHYAVSQFISQKEGFQSVFRQHEIQLKTGIERDAWALNWPNFMHIAYKWTHDSTSMLRHRETIVSKCLDPNLSNALKWRNTLKFWDDTLQYFPEYQSKTGKVA